MIPFIFLIAAFIGSSLLALCILVVERLRHPPQNGHYKEIEDKLNG